MSEGLIWRESSLLIDNRIPVALVSLPNQSVFNRGSEATVFIAEYYQFNALGTRIESINLIGFLVELDFDFVTNVTIYSFSSFL